MKSFKEYFKDIKNNKLPIIIDSKQEMYSLIAPSLFSLNNIKEDEKEAFKRKVVELVYSDEVINEFSDTINSPKENESEDEFVERAKNIMRKIIEKKLS